MPDYARKTRAMLPTKNGMEYEIDEDGDTIFMTPAVELETSLDTLSVTMVEDMVKQNFKIDAGLNLLDINTSISNIYFQKGYKETQKDSTSGGTTSSTAVFAGIRGGLENLRVKGHVGVNVHIKTSWFSLKEFSYGFENEWEFAAAIVGKASYATTFYSEKPIVKLKGSYHVFMLGLIPVVITNEPKIVLGFNADFEAGASLRLTDTLTYSNKSLTTYKDGKWSYKPDNKGFQNHGPHVDFALNGRFSTSVGIYFMSGAYIYGAAGPEFKLGPSLGFYVSGELVPTSNTMSCNASLDLKLGGSIGAQLKLWKWSLARWNNDFTLLSINLWGVKGSYPILSPETRSAEAPRYYFLKYPEGDNEINYPDKI